MGDAVLSAIAEDQCPVWREGHCTRVNEGAGVAQPWMHALQDRRVVGQLTMEVAALGQVIPDFPGGAKPAKRMRHLKKLTRVHKADVANVRQMLPYA